MNSRKVLVAGLPQTGKTTFLAAFWHFVQPSLDNTGMLTLESLAKGEHEYLNAISNKWLRFQPVTRTTPLNSSNTGKEAVSMNLKHSESGDRILLEIPDFQGETFKQQYETREWDTEYSDLLNDINGVLLFVGGEANNNRPTLITDANESALALGAEKPTSNDGITIAPWRVELSPNQVKLVDILQFITYYKPNIFPIRLTVLISAWDIIEKACFDNESPELWMQKNLPLLHQYLICNNELFEVKFIGISAQGCNYEIGEQVQHTLAKNPKERILIKEHNDFYHDITKIIAWLSDENKN